jgi:hypothetical protein
LPLAPADSKEIAMPRCLTLTLLTGVLLIGLATTGAAAGSSVGECNQDTAEGLLQENPDIDHAGPPFVIGQVLCGEFLGPGSQAMVLSFSPPTCGGFFGWAVFSRRSDGSWQLVWTYRNGQTSLVAVGAELEETNGILVGNQPRCVPAQSTKTRSWRWDGAKFVAGPWTAHLAGTHPSFVAEGKGRFGLICSIGDVPGGRNGASCESIKVVGRRVFKRRAELRPSGQVKVCGKFGAGSCGSFACGCTEDFPRIQSGERVAAGRFTCEVLPNAVKCTVASGSGFLMSATKIRRLT